jgi:hypothetical protein
MRKKEISISKFVQICDRAYFNPREAPSLSFSLTALGFINRRCI